MRHKGTQPQRQSFLSIDCFSVMVTAVKIAEDKQALIVRAYETTGNPAECQLELPLLERSVPLKFTPCEIKTLRIPLDKQEPETEVNMLEMNFFAPTSK